jgi:TonB-dependent starch-binding outer membrane protein SusC
MKKKSGDETFFLLTSKLLIWFILLSILNVKVSGRIFSRELESLLSMVPHESVQQDEHRVTGIITDNEGVTLPGVNIFVEGTTIGSVTDLDGRYTISAPGPTAVLVASFVGFTRQRIPIEGRENIDFVLTPEFRALDEVVVVGYGTRLREELTGSVSSISGDKMNISATPSILGRLQGQVAGIGVTTSNVPGGASILRIRGLGTITDSNPLYIIDGVPTDPSNNINPNDIESVSILKDASSAAIYGTRGANGVIIITTKRGRTNQRPTASFNIRTGISQAVNRHDLLNTQESGEMAFLEARNLGLTPGVNWTHAQYGSGSEPTIPDYIMPAGTMKGDAGTNPELYRFPEYTIIEANSQGTDWYDEILRNGLFQEYDLSVTGGGENIIYAFSGSYLNEEGFLINTGFERITLRSNTDAEINNWIKVGQSLNLSYTNSQGDLRDTYEETPIGWAHRIMPIIPVYDIGGNFAGSKTSGLGHGQNPVAMLSRAQNNFNNHYRIMGNVFGEANILDGLTFRSLFGFNYGQANFKTMTLTNLEAALSNTVDALSQGTNSTQQWHWSNVLNFNTTLSDAHRFNLILGTEAIDNSYQWMNAGRSAYFSIDPLYMQLSSGEINQINSGSGTEWSLFSVFGRLNYDLMGKYFIEGTLRHDGSSRFGSSNRFATFPAASVAWGISEEPFMEGTRDWVDLLKLRLGWGISGNDRIGNYNIYSTYATHAFRSAYDLSGTNTSSVMGFQPSSRGNPVVTWETTQTINAGLDLTAFRNSLNFSFDLWERNTYDMLYQVSVPHVMGIATPPHINIGEMRNRGFDIELGYGKTALAGKFRYGVTATISRYVNELMKLSDDLDEDIIVASYRGITYSRATKGRSFPEYYGYISDGIFQSAEEADNHPTAFGPGGTYNKPGRLIYRNLDENNVINADDMTYIGSPHPDFTGGLGIDLGYSNWSLNAFFYGSYGNDMINLSHRWLHHGMLDDRRSKDALFNSWGSPYLDSNADATIPIIDRADGTIQNSTYWIEDGSFLRLKSLSIGYTLPYRITNRMQINNVRVFCQITNLFTITNYSGLDPELYSSVGSMGLDQGTWPTPRQIMFGLNLGL